RRRGSKSALICVFPVHNTWRSRGCARLAFVPREIRLLSNGEASIKPRSKVRPHMAKASKKTSNKPLSKSAILEAITSAVGEDLSKKQIKLVVETLVEVGHRELKKTGVFVLPGFAKFTVVKKPARPAREGINPF